MMTTISSHCPAASALASQAGEERCCLYSQAARITASCHQNVDLTLITAEGDRVTLSAEAEIRAMYTSYAQQGVAAGGEATVQGESLSFFQSQALSISVEGDLNARELKAVKKALGAIEKIVGDFLSGWPDQGAAALEGAGSAQEQAGSWEQGPSGVEIDWGALPSPRRAPFEGFDRVTDKILSVAEKAGVKRPKMAKALRGFFGALLERLSQEEPPGSKRHAAAGRLARNLLGKIGDTRWAA